MLHDLRENAMSISMEAASGLEAADKAAERIPTFLESAAEYLNRNVFQPLSNAFATKDLNWVANELQRKNYSEMRAIKISAPENFKGSLLDYGNALLAASEDMDALHDKVLVPLDSWVNGRLGDPNSLKSLTNTLKVPGLHDMPIDALNKRLDRFFPDKADTRVPIYGEVIARQSDWKGIADTVRKINTVYANGNYEKVCKKQAELTYSLRLLAKRIGEAPEEYKLSSVTTEQLSKVVIGVAEQIEFYGVLRSRVDQYLRSISDNQMVMSHYLKGQRVSMEGLFDIFRSKPTGGASSSQGGKKVSILQMSKESRATLKFKSGPVNLPPEGTAYLVGLDNPATREKVMADTFAKVGKLKNSLALAGKTHVAKLRRAIQEVDRIHDDQAFYKACDQKLLPLFKAINTPNAYFKDGPLGLVGDAVFSHKDGQEKPWYAVIHPAHMGGRLPAIANVEELEVILKLRGELDKVIDDLGLEEAYMEAPDMDDDDASRVHARLEERDEEQGQFVAWQFEELTYRGSDAGRPEEYIGELYSYLRRVEDALVLWMDSSIVH